MQAFCINNLLLIICAGILYAGAVLCMADRSPLTTEQLQEICARRQRDEDVMRLLWEIHRLRATVVRCNDYFARLEDGWGGGPVLEGILLDARSRLQAEPVVLDGKARWKRRVDG